MLKLPSLIEKHPEKLHGVKLNCAQRNLRFGYALSRKPRVFASLRPEMSITPQRYNQNAIFLRKNVDFSKNGKTDGNCATRVCKKCPKFKHEFEIQALYSIFRVVRIYFSSRAFFESCVSYLACKKEIHKSSKFIKRKARKIEYNACISNSWLNFGHFLQTT